MASETFPKVPKTQVGGLAQTAVDDQAQRLLVVLNSDGLSCTVAVEWPDPASSSGASPPAPFASQELFPAVPRHQVGGFIQTAVGDGALQIEAEANLGESYRLVVNWPANVPGGLLAADIKPLKSKKAKSAAPKRRKSKP